MLSQVTRGTALAGAAIMARAGRRSRTATVIGGALMCTGALAARWSIFKAGFASAGDPKYVVAPQRERIERGQSAGAARREPRIGAPEAPLGSPAMSLAERRSARGPGLV
jgi:hypothetical protein